MREFWNQEKKMISGRLHIFRYNGHALVSRMSYFPYRPNFTPFIGFCSTLPLFFNFFSADVKQLQYFFFLKPLLFFRFVEHSQLVNNNNKNPLKTTKLVYLVLPAV